jgi:hypothetical protein
MPVWAWIAIGLGVLAVAFFVLVIWAYPRDNSF